MKSAVNIKAFLGYIWAVLAIAAVVAGIMNLNLAKRILVDEYGARISDNWSGGMVETKKDYGQYTAYINKPVFEGLISERNTGFIQIKWAANKALPGIITEEVDYDKDGNKDFSVTVDTVSNNASLEKFNNRVLKVWSEGVLVYDKSRIIRVEIKK